MRHDLRVWESSVGRRPRLKGDDGAVLLGDEVLGGLAAAHDRRARHAFARTTT